MRTLTLRQLCLLAASAIGAILITGCATNGVYRTYYQDPHCRIFYIDKYGNRVYEWKSTAPIGCPNGMCVRRDVGGRLYYDDSFGNRYYKGRVCHKYCRW